LQQASKWKLPFSDCSVFHLQNSGNKEIWTWRHRHEIWKHEEMEIWTHGDMDIETRRHGHGEMDMEHGYGDQIKQKTEAQAVFLIPFTVFSLSKRKFVVCLLVD
jgi:hypothetical protein